MEKHVSIRLAFVLLLSAAFARGIGAEEAASSVAVIDADLGSIDEIAGAILDETGGLKLDIEKLQAKIRELQSLNGEAGSEIGKLNAKVVVLVDRTQVLGKRYDEVIEMAKAYKAKYKKTRTVAVALGVATVALGGVLVCVAASK